MGTATPVTHLGDLDSKGNRGDKARVASIVVGRARVTSIVVEKVETSGMGRVAAKEMGGMMEIVEKGMITKGMGGIMETREMIVTTIASRKSLLHYYNNRLLHSLG
jgi:hypothetical protein